MAAMAEVLLGAIIMLVGVVFGGAMGSVRAKKGGQ